MSRRYRVIYGILFTIMGLGLLMVIVGMIGEAVTR